MTGSDTTSEASMAGLNPYIGPKPFETGRRIFGRDRETEDLYYLLSSERIVLLHSPSGAGKSSLLQAGLIPRLAGRFDVWGPTRVNLRPPPDLPAGVNRYIRSAILGFEEGIPQSRRRSEDQLNQMTLAEYVNNRPRRRSAPENIVLILDQFEEILTSGPLEIAAKREFFSQIGTLLLNPRIWAIFSLREDYLAPLDPYSGYVPTHFKNRFRLDLLTREAALEAIAGPALQGGREFTPEAVGKVINDLSTVKVQQPDGSFIDQPGEYVEPLHLQVVCRRLWNQMPGDDLRIDLEDVVNLGDVSEALSGYYSTEVREIAGGDDTVERAIREWVGNRLIRAGGIRGQVLKGAGKSEGLDNDLIAQLVDAHLVRGEVRSGAAWYELAHDRLIEPVRSDNKKWFDDHLHKFQKVALIWNANGNPDSLLLLGADLNEANEWKQSNADRLTEVENKFLESSNAKQSVIDQRRSLRKMKVAGWVLAAVVLILSILGINLWLVYKQVVAAWSEAKIQSELASQQKVIAESNMRLAQAEEKKARDLSEAARQLAARELALKLQSLARQKKLDEVSEVIESIKIIADNEFRFSVSVTPADAEGTGFDTLWWIELHPKKESLEGKAEKIARIYYILNHESFYQNLRVGLPQNNFLYKYRGWGCLEEVMAIVEYKDPKTAPSISFFDQCAEWKEK